MGSMSFSLLACSKKEIKSVMDKDEIIVGLDDAFAPMGFKNESGEIVGFDVDLAKEVGQRLDKEVIFQPIDWSMKESELNSGNIDFIWNGYTITEERKEKVDFSEAYLNNKQVIVTLATADINAKSDLAGKKVGAQSESSAIEAMESIPDDASVVASTFFLPHLSNRDYIYEYPYDKGADYIVLDLRFDEVKEEDIDDLIKSGYEQVKKIRSLYVILRKK